MYVFIYNIFSNKNINLKPTKGNMELPKYDETNKKQKQCYIKW